MNDSICFASARTRRTSAARTRTSVTEERISTSPARTRVEGRRPPPCGHVSTKPPGDLRMSDRGEVRSPRCARRSLPAALSGLSPWARRRGGASDPETWCCASARCRRPRRCSSPPWACASTTMPSGRARGGCRAGRRGDQRRGRLAFGDGGSAGACLFNAEQRRGHRRRSRKPVRGLPLLARQRSEELGVHGPAAGTLELSPPWARRRMPAPAFVRTSAGELRDQLALDEQSRCRRRPEPASGPLDRPELALPTRALEWYRWSRRGRASK